MLIIGVDPGFSGAIALLDPDSRKLELHDMPLLPDPKSGKEDLDDRRLAEILAGNGSERTIAVLERVSSMPEQGLSSTFRFGLSYGAVRLALRAHGHEFHNPTPQTWKKHFRMKCRGSMTQSQYKRMSLSLAKERFPHASEQLSRVKDHGRAEAALIALYGSETLL
jgi:crossover junction endodeoxyribonuclease RuvC